MRASAIFLCLACSAIGLSQRDLPPEFATEKPDAVIEVRAAPTGSQYVTITMVRDGYPAELLESQCQQLGAVNGNPIRGLNIEETGTGASHEGKPMAFCRAHFAVDGLFVKETGQVHLLPFAKAFAGAPAPNTVQCLAITFLGYAAGPNTISAAESATAKVVGIADKSVPLLEYRIILKSQTPADIDFPETPQQQTKSTKKASSNRVPIGLIAVVCSGSVVAGVLVYFALRPRRGGRGKTQAKK